MKLIDIARICHGAWKAYCEIHNELVDAWEYFPDAAKDDMVVTIKKIRKDDKLTPKDIHDIWVAEKLREGWSYGTVKDPGSKKHPCLVPYEKLSEMEKRKDSLILDLVRSLSSEIED